MQRIDGKLRIVGRFQPTGKDLGQERIVGVATTNAGQKRLRHEHGKGGRGGGGFGRQFRRQSKPATEFDRVADGLC